MPGFSKWRRGVSASTRKRWRPIAVWVERTFRKEKSPFEARPIYPHRDDTRIGHIVASFLALRLKVDLQARLEEKGVSELVA